MHGAHSDLDLAVSMNLFQRMLVEGYVGLSWLMVG